MSPHSQRMLPFDQADEPSESQPPPGPRAPSPKPARYFEELEPEAQLEARERRAAELASVAELSFPVEALFDGEQVTILGPAGRFEPQKADDQRYGRKEDPFQLLAEGADGRRFVSFATAFEVDGKPLVTRTLPLRPKDPFPVLIRTATCPLEALELHREALHEASLVFRPFMTGERDEQPRSANMDEEPPRQDETRKTLFHEAVRRYDLLRAGARELGFEEAELEEAFSRHAAADLHDVAFPLEEPSEPPQVTLLRELEGEFVRLAALRWAERSREFPQLENLAEAWAHAFARGGELSELQVRRVLGVKNSYEEKQDRRRERLEAAAERASGRSAEAYEESNRHVAGIPFGQPILVGHHSERRHRRDLERAQRAMDRSVEEQKRAEELERKAKAVGRAGISSDDPDAIEKLREKLTELEREREQMKRVNQEYRRGGWDAVQALSPEGKERCRRVMEQAPWVRAPFESYSLTNIGANIRRVKERIAELEQRAEEALRAPVEGRGFRLEEDATENRLRFFFDAKPPETVRTALKQAGFRWSPSAKAWQRQLTNAGRAAADRVRAALESAEG